MSEAIVHACAACGKEASNDTTLQQCARCKNRSYCGKECQQMDWQTHKTTCKCPNYLLKVQLCPDRIKDPQVFRTLSCPADTTFAQLHRALQVAFSWADTHTYDFMVKDPAEVARMAAKKAAGEEPDIMEIIRRRMELQGQPQSEERHLLRLVEAAPHGPGGFAGGKGIDFMHNDARRHRDTPEKPSNKVRLREVFEHQHLKNKPLEYEYDFGDCWEHQITILGRDDTRDFFMCKDGEGHYVAEDAGSVQGWETLKKAYRAARPNKEQREKMHWFENQASNADPHGLKNGRERAWAKGDINRRLAELAGKTFGFV
ncbi:hypothetical protein ACLMJK_002865 [Lecanora helva]